MHQIGLRTTRYIRTISKSAGLTGYAVKNRCALTGYGTLDQQLPSMASRQKTSGVLDASFLVMNLHNERIRADIRYLLDQAT